MRFGGGGGSSGGGELMLLLVIPMIMTTMVTRKALVPTQYGCMRGPQNPLVNDYPGHATTRMGVKGMGMS